MINAASTYQTKERQLSWDEENRLRAICDNGYVSSYFYDAGGERTVKLHGSGEGIHVNGVFSGGYTNNADYTLYVNAYMVLEKGGQYTKHIYIGDQRIVSKLGDVGSFGVDPRREEYAGEDVSGTDVPDYKTKYSALQQVIKDNYQLFKVDYYGVDNDDYVDGAGFCCEPTPQLRSLPTENVNYERLQYYYHSDHLGSASYITNLDGEVVQHIEYVPFGEVFIEERNNTWNTPYLFNGKELDEETGLYYYGARYYNPRISLWYGVDPVAEKYPNFSPYCYTMNNPVMLIDPDGMEIDEGSKKEWERQKGYVTKQRDKLQSKSDGLVAKAEKKGWNSEQLAKKQGNLGERISSLNISLETMGTLEASDQVYSLSQVASGELGGLTLDTKNNVISINYGSTSNFVHEMTHAGQFETGDMAFNSKTGLTLGQDIYDEVAAYKAQFAYSPSSVSGLTSTSVPNSFGSITTSWVQGLAGGSLYVPLGHPNYIQGVSANTGVSSININSGKSAFVKAYPNAAIMKSLPTNFILKNLPTTYYKK